MAYKIAIPCIYKITSPSGKVYIGQTNHFKKRLSHYRNLACKKQTKLYNSLMKYGFDAHNIEIVQMCEVHELNELESYYIKKYDSFNTKLGMNLRSGGHESKMTDEARQKLSRDRMGDKHHNYGKQLSPEWRKRISEGNKGKQMSEANRIAVSITNKGRKMSDEAKRKMIKARTGKTGALCKNSYPVNQYSIDGAFVKRWDSVMDVYRELGHNPRNISANCRKERRVAYGFVWKYENDATPLEIKCSNFSKKKKIFQFDLLGNFIKEWDSAKDAAIFLELKRASQITACCTGRRINAHGFKWKHNEQQKLKQ